MESTQDIKFKRIENDDVKAPHSQHIKMLFDPSPRCASFIVTIYGDVIEPRGGVLSMANLIELCSFAGLNESQVRTSVSRLVNAGQLRGERIGRNSFYRLTAETRDEYAQAAHRIYIPAPTPTDWIILARRDVEQDQQLLTQGFAVLNRNLLIGPQKNIPYPDTLIFEARVAHDPQRLPDFIASLWNIEEISKSYEQFISKFEPFLTGALAGTVNDCTHLIIRLALVHEFRLILATDPDLPQQGLPNTWPGRQARIVFASLYLQLTAAAERYIGAALFGESGALESETAITEQRQNSLRTQIGQ